jgi:hypothetical protein
VLPDKNEILQHKRFFQLYRRCVLPKKLQFIYGAAGKLKIVQTQISVKIRLRLISVDAFLWNDCG